MALTEAQKRLAEKNRQYWSAREAEQLRHNITDEEDYDRELQRIYSDMLDACQSEINGFYGKYASKEGITIAEAKKRVSQLDIAAYERKAKKYVKDHDFSDKANEEMRLYNATMKINRLEMLKANIGLELISGHNELEKFMGGILQGRTEDELKRQAGILGKTVRNNAAKARSIVNASFHNAKFSDRIWLYQDLLKEDLSKLLQSGLIQGKNPRVLAKEIRKAFQTSTYNSERLMRTELARVQTDAQKQSFERNGFETYQFIVNHGCCDICEEIAKRETKYGKGVYLVEKMQPGENAPPMHPHCRCSTAAYEDDAEYEAWLDFLDKGGTTEEWNNLKKSRTTVEKSENGSIIKSGAVSGALTSKNDPDFQRRGAFANAYYAEVLGRKREYEIAAVSKNSGFSEKDVSKIFAHIFELEHLFSDGSIHKFDTDYDMAQSWIRLREGKNIQEHDMILLNHELMEAEIMGTGTTIPYEPTHDKVTQTYDYKAALMKYLRENGLE